MEESHFPPGQGTFRKIGVQFWRKVDVAGYTPPFFGHGRVKVGVDQSAVSVSRCKIRRYLAVSRFDQGIPCCDVYPFFLRTRPEILLFEPSR